MQATVLSCKLDMLDTLNKKRRALAERYNRNLETIAGVVLPYEQEESKHVYHQYSIRVCDPENKNISLQKQFMTHLEDHNIGCRIFYPQLLSDIEFFNTRPELKNPCPVAEQTVRTIVSLPIWPELGVSDINYVCDVIKGFGGSVQDKTERVEHVKQDIAGV